MKKFYAITLVVLICGIIGGCGNKKNDSIPVSAISESERLENNQKEYESVEAENSSVGDIVSYDVSSSDVEDIQESSYGDINSCFYPVIDNTFAVLGISDSHFLDVMYKAKHEARYIEEDEVIKAFGTPSESKPPWGYVYYMSDPITGKEYDIEKSDIRYQFCIDGTGGLSKGYRCCHNFGEEESKRFTIFEGTLIEFAEEAHSGEVGFDVIDNLFDGEEYKPEYSNLKTYNDYASLFGAPGVINYINTESIAIDWYFPERGEIPPMFLRILFDPVTGEDLPYHHYSNFKDLKYYSNWSDVDDQTGGWSGWYRARRHEELMNVRMGVTKDGERLVYDYDEDDPQYEYWNYIPVPLNVLTK